MNQLATLPGKDEPEVQIGKWRMAITFTSLCAVQGFYYLITGLWPLLSLETFEVVTGEKYDDWLVRTVGVLVTVQAAVLLLAAWRRQYSLEVTVLAVGSAAMLALIDTFYALGRVISFVYLIDAVIEVLLIIGWARFLMARRNANRFAPLGGGGGSAALPQ